MSDWGTNENEKVTRLWLSPEEPNNLMFGGLASLRHGTELPHTVLWTHNNGIQLHKIAAIWRKITNDL